MGERHSVDHVKWWKRVRRNIHNNIGKSFDMTFHYYCTQVPKYQQRLFLDEFLHYPEYWYKFHPGYYVDEQGNIQKVIRSFHKRSIKIYSDDYRVAYKSKIYHHQQWKNEERSEIPWNESKKDYETIIYGTVQEFESRRDPVVIKYRRDKYQKDKLKERRRKAEKKAKSLEIFNRGIQLQKEEIKKQRDLDILKRDQAGFDDESFKGEFYHGRKNKK